MRPEIVLIGPAPFSGHATVGRDILDPMTAKQVLRDRIEELSEEEAADWLGFFEDARPIEREPLSSEQLSIIERGLADARAGRLTPHAEVRRRFGLD